MLENSAAPRLTRMRSQYRVDAQTGEECRNRVGGDASLAQGPNRRGDRLRPRPTRLGQGTLPERAQAVLLLGGVDQVEKDGEGADQPRHLFVGQIFDQADESLINRMATIPRGDRF